MRISLRRFTVVALTLALPVALHAQAGRDFGSISGPSRAAGKRAMTLDDGFRMVSVGGAQISPDGRWAFFSKTSRDFATDSSKTTWWLAPTDASTPAKQFIGEAGASGVQWAADSRTLYFFRTVNKVRQLHSISLDGGEALALTEFKENEGTWTLGPTGAFFVIRRPEKDSVLEKKKKDGWDHVYVDEGSNGQSAEQWSNLWTYTLATKKLERVTKNDWSIGAMDISDDGKRIVVAARADNKRNTGGASELYLIDVASKAVTRLTDNKGPEQGPVWAPDNRTVIFEAVSLDKWDSGNGDLWSIDVETKAIKNLTKGHTGPVGTGPFSADGKYMYFSGGYGTARYPQRVELATGKIENVVTTKGIVNASSWSKDASKFLYSYQDFTTPPDLYVGSVPSAAGGQPPTSNSQPPTRLTDLNPWIRDSIEMGNVELLQWKSAKDFTIEGILHTPAGYNAAAKKPIPLILNIHGGPAGAWTNSFSPIAHVYNGLGYALLSPNVRGSTGYDDKLMRGNMNDIGGGDYQDLMTGVDAVVAKGITVPDSIALRGWSYGGILGGWTITQTPRFKAASLGAMVSDWTSEYGPGFNFDVSLWYIGGDPWANAKEFREKSSLTYVNKVKTPTLLLHGDNDITDTPAQSMNFFAGLQHFGVPSRYVRFPNEPHGFGKMKHQRVRDTEEIQWMQSYVRGLKDYKYPEPASDKKKAAVVP